LFEGG